MSGGSRTETNLIFLSSVEIYNQIMADRDKPCYEGAGRLFVSGYRLPGP